MMTQRMLRLMTLGLCLLATIPATAGEKRPATVRDSIAMTILVDPNAAWARFRPNNVGLSPDGKHFVVVTSKGNVATGQNEFSLLLYDVDATRMSVNNPAAPQPSPTVLARFASTSNRSAIDRVRWLEDSRTLAFLGEKPGEVSQVYTIDSKTRAVTRHSSHPTPVLDFDFNLSSQRFIYAAETPLDWTDRKAHGFVVGTENITDASGNGTSYLFSRTSYFVGTRGGGKPLAVDVAPYKAIAPWGLWLSPKGTSAIAVRYVGEPPAGWWDEYTPLVNFKYVRDGNTQAARLFTTGHIAFFLQFVRIDLATGHATPIFDAPSGQYSGGEIGAHWLDDDRFILADTYLPLTGVTPEEEQRRRAAPSLVEVDKRTNAVRRIVDLGQEGEGDRAYGTFVRSRLLSPQRLLVEHRKRGVAGNQTVQYQRDADGNWAQIDVGAAGVPLLVDVVQSVDQAPELRATDPATGKNRVITDLNPQLRNLDLGTVETIEWKDANGYAWSGGLLKPVNYQPGTRYPLVIQTHGYSPNSFLMDGPDGSTAGYAARALAGRGIMVLQVQDEVGPIGRREEWLNQSPGYAAILDRLDREGLIDRKRVGMHGWSRTGYYVQHAITFSDLGLAAASVSDASDLSIYKSMRFFGLGYPGMIEDERMIGAPFWGDENVKLWAERDPTFHLDRVRTPLRIEQYGHGVDSWWSTYVLLRRHQRPVEYVSLPDAVHSPVKPWERMTTQENVVDWYDFWLNDHEDSDPAKAAQYARWHELRRQQAAAAKERSAVK